MHQHLTRREVVKNLGKFGAMSAFALSPAAGLASAFAPCRPFSIVLHGLFVLDIFSLDNHVRISTPYCNGHKYLAGPWSKCPEDYATVNGMHEQMWDSHIQTMPPPGGMPVLASHVGDPDHNKAYLSFAVPYPTTIRALRCFDESEVNYPKCCIQASKFPLVLSLEYDYFPNFPPIAGTSLDPNNNYHVFAEPPDDMKCDQAIQHGKDAIGKLWAMFPNPPSSVPLPKDPDKCSKPPDNSGSPCDRKPEEYGLAELKEYCKGSSRSVHLPLCANFIVL